MNVKLLLNQQVRDQLNFQRGLLVLVFFLLTAFGAQAQTIKTDQADYLPGDIVQITGDGWQSGEQVKLEIDHSTISHGNTVLYATADNNGLITNNEYVIQQIHLGESFVLLATGISSGSTAKTTFTDGNLLESVSISAQNPATVIKGNDASYIVTITRKRNSGSFTGTTLSLVSVPVGVTPSFSPSTIDFTTSDISNGVLSKTSTLTLRTTSTTTAQTFTARAYKDNNDVVTTPGTLTVTEKTLLT